LRKRSAFSPKEWDEKQGKNTQKAEKNEHLFVDE
jgi:hypothetical protein